MNRIAGRILLVVLASLLLPAGVCARSKTDLVYLVNGDRLTGEIKQLDRGILKLSTSALSTVNIEWADVDSLNSVYEFRLEDRAGHKRVGAIFMRHDRTVEVIRKGATYEVPRDSVVALTPLEASFWQQLDGSFSIGYSYTKSDKNTQLNTSGWVLRRTIERQLRFDFSSIVKSTAQTPTTVRYDVSLDYRRLLKGILFAESTAKVGRNDEQGLDLRTSLSGALGANLVKSNRVQLVSSAGVSVNREFAADNTQTDNIEGLVSVQHDIFAYNFPKIDYTTTLDVYPSFTNWGRIRADLNIHARREIVSDFFVELTFYDSYDNRPPANGQKTDYGLTFSLGWSF